MPYGGVARTGVGPREAVELALARWKDYEGRSSRSEYWWFAGALILLWFVVSLISNALFPTTYNYYTGSSSQNPLATVLALALLAVTIVFGLPLSIRRLHDSGKPGVYYLFSFVPCVGGFIVFVFMLLETQPFVNQWGPPPK